MNKSDVVTFRCIALEQPIGEFYIGVIDAEDLVAISWADVRQIDPHWKATNLEANEPPSPPKIRDYDDIDIQIEELDEDAVLVEDQSFEQFLGIQRQLSPGRVAEIRQYVGTVDAAFPTAVLLAVSSDYAEFNKGDGTMSIVKHSKVAKIIDGQHRIAGLRESGVTGFQVNVALFIDMDIQDQAMVFATINLKQTKVNKSLTYDLLDFTKSRSPQRTCHDIARFLNYRQNSPFQGRIKMLGVARHETETITQATFVDRLLRLISRNPMSDRDNLRRRRRIDRATGIWANRQIFRNLFVDDRDDTITIIIWNFFLAVSQKWPESWRKVETGNVLNRTTGFGALMRFMRVAYLSMETSGRVVTSDKYQSIFDKVDLPDGSFKPEIYLPGSSGEKALFDALVEQAGLERFK